MIAGRKLDTHCRQVSVRSQHLKAQECSSRTPNSQEGLDVGAFLRLFASATKSRPLAEEPAAIPPHLCHVVQLSRLQWARRLHAAHNAFLCCSVHSVTPTCKQSKGTWTQTLLQHRISRCAPVPQYV